MIKRILATLAVVLASQLSAAQSTGPKQICSPWVNGINAATMEANRTFEVERRWSDGSYGLVVVLISLTDANTSITRFDMTVTASDDNNTTDYTIQSCTTSAGACTSDDAAWRKASPGSANWPWRVDVEGFEDYEFTFAVGTGTGAAADLLTVDYRLCTKGS